ARHYAPGDYGALASAISVATFVSVFYGFGITQYWLAAYGREGWGAQRWIRSSIRLVLISTVLINLVYIAWAAFGPHSGMERDILLILSFFSIGQLGVDIVAAKLQLEEKYTKLAAWQAVPQASRFLASAIILFLVKGSDVRCVAIVFGLVGMVVLIIGWISAQKMVDGEICLVGHGPKPRVDLQPARQLKDLWYELYPFGAAAALGFIYSQGNIVMVRYLTDETGAGIYSAAQTLMNAVMLLPVIVFHKYLIPKYHRWAYSDGRKLRSVYVLSEKVMAASGIAFMFVFLIFSEEITSLIFGRSYKDSAAVIRILSLAIPVYFLSYSSAAVLATRGNMKKKIKYMLLAAISNVILNVILVPAHGPVG
ncbi:MAG: oligosaccharide flippase family protein, partial [Nitrososphaerales archaeon]